MPAPAPAPTNPNPKLPAATKEALVDQLEGVIHIHPSYRERISEMVAHNRRSLALEYEDLLRRGVDVLLLEEKPSLFLSASDEALLRVLQVEVPEVPVEELRDAGYHARIRGFGPPTPLRMVGSSDVVGRFITVRAMVVRASRVLPRILKAVYRCPAGHGVVVEDDGTGRLSPPDVCPICASAPAPGDGGGGGGGGRRAEPGRYHWRDWTLDNEASRKVNHQVLRLQELPEELPPGQLPHYVDVILEGDLAGARRPGEAVTVSGVVKAKVVVEGEGRPAGAGAPPGPTAILLKPYLEANYLEGAKREDEGAITPEDEAAIRGLAKDPEVYDKLIQSFAPSIVGLEAVKEAILLQLVGAPDITLPDGRSLRGEIHVLLVGDPGMGKSELLKYAARVAPRGLYTTGKGSTAAGLTAAVVKDENGLMTLEAGAVVLADKGLAAVDEFDKMRAEDRAVLHEVMEQGTVSIAKGGIVATLNARTSVLAAANPTLGRYDEGRHLHENINLPPALFTRFDLIFAFKDRPGERDRELAGRILGQMASVSGMGRPPIGLDLLRKYIAYARRVEPRLTPEAIEMLTGFYAGLRRGAPREALTVTTRQLESLARLATAHARLHLRGEVTREDAEAALRMAKIAFNTIGVNLDVEPDLGVLYGLPKEERATLSKALKLFREMEASLPEGQEGEGVPLSSFVRELAARLDITEEEAERVAKQLIRQSMIFDAGRGRYTASA